MYKAESDNLEINKLHCVNLNYLICIIERWIYSLYVHNLPFHFIKIVPDKRLNKKKCLRV